MWDPVKKRRFYWAWADDVAPASALTLTREITWHGVLQQFVYAPLEEQALLRGKQLVAVGRTALDEKKKKLWLSKGWAHGAGNTSPRDGSASAERRGRCTRCAAATGGASRPGHPGSGSAGSGSGLRDGSASASRRFRCPRSAALTGGASRPGHVGTGIAGSDFGLFARSRSAIRLRARCARRAAVPGGASSTRCFRRSAGARLWRAGGTGTSTRRPHSSTRP